MHKTNLQSETRSPFLSSHASFISTMAVLGLSFVILSGIIVIPSVPIYAILLFSHWRYQKKAPFSSTFFKISFHLGIFDFLHLFNDWVIGVLPYLGLRDFILRHNAAFAKQYSCLWWYSALCQKFAVSLLAADRLANMWFNYVRLLTVSCC